MWVSILLFIILWAIIGNDNLREFIDFLKDLLGDILGLIVSVLFGLLVLFLIFKLIL